MRNREKADHLEGFILEHFGRNLCCLPLDQNSLFWSILSQFTDLPEGMDALTLRKLMVYHMAENAVQLQVG